MNRLTLDALLVVLDWDVPDAWLPALVAQQYHRLTLGCPDDAG
jgi:hypothetical protein